MAPKKSDGLNPRLLNFSMVVDARLEELLMITIFAPQVANFSTIPMHKCRHPQKSQRVSRVVTGRIIIDKKNQPYQNAKANN